MDESGARAQHRLQVRSPGRKNATIALFPGSFKPAHAAHIHGIRYLLEKTELTEVIIIISNRCRLIPGTGCALDADAAHRILQTMLRSAGISMERIRIEIAEHRATAHALEYFGRVNPGDSLLFCMGTQDFVARDDRFASVAARSKACGISARVEVLPSAPMDVHATELRQFIAAGNAGRRNFFSVLPPELSAEQKGTIWAGCRNSLRPVSEIIKPKIRAALADRYATSLHSLDCCNPQSIDPVFRFRDVSGDNFTVKYAGDTTVAGGFAEQAVPKPARRLAVEKRALRHLARHLDTSIWRPAVDFYDRQKRIIVLTRPPVTATNIDVELRSGVFDTASAAASASLLSRLHQCSLPKEPFWRDRGADRDHWQVLIDGLGIRGNRKLRELGRSDLGLRLSTAGAQPCVLHLNFIPRHLWRIEGRVGIENFERACSFGDPAFDIATFVSAYILSGVQCNAMARCLSAVEAFLTTYKHRHHLIDTGFSSRVIGYIAYCLLTVPAFRTARIPSGYAERIAIDLLEWVDLSCSAPPPRVADSLLQCFSTATSGIDWHCRRVDDQVLVSTKTLDRATVRIGSEM